MEFSRHRPPLQTGNLPALSEDPASASATSSPARGREMRTNLLQKLRAPPLVHTWDFWHEKPGIVPRDSNLPPDQQHFAPDLTNLLTVSDVKTFWSLFNNFDFTGVPQKSSVHLFHSHVKPIWEDPRNIRGGSWTFRIPKAAAQAFWTNVCLLAIGEHLQEAVRSERITFKDDICGISLRPRYASTLVTVWNRDGDHKEGIQRIAEKIVGNMPPELTPKEGSYYYKKHSEHDGFDKEAAAKIIEADRAKKLGGNTAQQQSSDVQNAETEREKDVQDAEAKSEKVHGTVNQVEAEVEKVKKILEEVEVHDELIEKKVATSAEQ